MVTILRRIDPTYVELMCDGAVFRIRSVHSPHRVIVERLSKAAVKCATCGNQVAKEEWIEVSHPTFCVNLSGGFRS